MYNQYGAWDPKAMIYVVLSETSFWKKFLMLNQELRTSEVMEVRRYLREVQISCLPVAMYT